MDPRSVDVGRGAAWVAGGWRLFAKSPAMWIVLTIVFAVILLVLARVPFGAFVFTLFAPALAAGLIFGAAELAGGRALEFNHLYRAFADSAKLKPLLVLGAVALGAGLLSALVLSAFVGAFPAGMDMNDPADLHMMRLGPEGLIGVLLALTVQLVAAGLTYFAVPLVMLHGVAPAQAMQSSLRACLRNIAPLFVFSLIYLLLAFGATLLFGLGWLVLVPWSVGMLYCTYMDIYSV